MKFYYFLFENVKVDFKNGPFSFFWVIAEEGGKSEARLKLVSGS